MIVCVRMQSAAAHFSARYYRKQQDVTDGEGGDDVGYEPRPQVADSDPLDVQNSFLRRRADQDV